MLYRDFIILTYNAHFMSIVYITSTYHAYLLSIISMIRNIDYIILSILLRLMLNKIVLYKRSLYRDRYLIIYFYI